MGLNMFSFDCSHHYILVLILRLRQMCCHPNLILAQAEEYDDPTMLLAGDGDKEVARAMKAKGKIWVDKVRLVAHLCSTRAHSCSI